MLYCFLDTNIFLQYKTFDNIKWPEVINASEVCLVVPRKVVQELDKHKHDPASNRRRNRARLVLKKIEQYLENAVEIRPGVSIKVQTSNPKSEWLEEHGYDPDDPDDVIVGSAHFFRDDHPEEDVLLFADDFGARLKATANNVPVMAPPDDLQFPAEPDPLQKENQKLQRELLRLQNSQPKLAMKFRNENGDLIDIIDFYIDFNQSKMLDDEIEEELKRKFESLKYYDKSGDLRPTTWTEFLNGLPPQGEIDKYHHELQQFLQGEYREFLFQSKVYENREQFAQLVELVVENNGTAPAPNVDVILRWPNGLAIFEDLPFSPYEPDPPQKPKRSDPMADSAFNYLVPNSIISLPSLGANHFNGPSGPSMLIDKTDNGYEIDWGPVDLKHHHTWSLDELYLRFDPINGETTGFEIEYEITADNLPDKVTDKLVIRLHSV